MTSTNPDVRGKSGDAVEETSEVDDSRGMSRHPAHGRSASRSPEREACREIDSVTSSRGGSIGYGTLSLPYSMEDNLRNKSEMKILKSQLRQVQNDLRNEQDSVLQLRRRLNTAEGERLDEGTKANEEVVNWQTQVAKLRCQIERIEAAKQNVEFDLAKSRRETTATRKNASDREDMLKSQIENLKEQVGTQERHLSELQHQIQVHRHAASEQDGHYRMALEEKEKEGGKLRSEIDMMTAERDRLEIVIEEKNGALSDLNEKVQELEDKMRAQGDTIRRQIAEIEFGKDREEHVKKDLEAALLKLQTLEESIETERAAHLESKFNSEITQLRVRDLEGALEYEKNARSENTSTVESLNRQLQEVERAYNEDKIIAKDTEEKLQNLETEHAGLKQQLNDELTEKKTIIQDLSKQLELHEKNFEELKEELTKAKKRQAYLEETYGGSMRELELLLDSFNLDGAEKKKKGKKVDSNQTQKPISPSLVLENLRHTLMEYKRNLNRTSEELAKMKSHCEHLGKECDSYKDMIWTKDKALEDTQKGYSQTSKELNRVRSDVVELEAQMAAVKVELQGAVDSKEKERTRADESSRELLKISKRFKADDEDKMNFLHMLYQRLLAGKVLVSEAKGQLLSNYSWYDLSNMIHEQLSSLLSAVQRAEEKVKHLENVVQSKEEMLDQMQRSHEEQYKKLEALAQDREKAWQRQKTELEDHYTRLLADVHVRSKKSQSLAEQAWERVHATGTIQQGLEGELLDLRNQQDRLKNENSSLLISCALLAGAFYPIYSRYTNLVNQHGYLEERAVQLHSLNHQAKMLVSMLDSAFDNDAELTPPGKRSPHQLYRSPLSMFRVAGIAVLAANRLVYFAGNTTRMFTSYDLSTGLGGLPVSVGCMVSPQKLRGVGFVFPTSDKASLTLGQERAGSWLVSEELRHCLLNSTTEVQDALAVLQRDGGVDPKLITGSARNSFAKLMDKLQVFFETSVFESGFRDKHSLIRKLGDGLTRTIKHMGPREKVRLSSPQQAMGQLQSLILELTQSLHSAEVDCRTLQEEVKNMADENYRMKDIASQAMDLKGEVDSLRCKHDNMVEAARFETLCQELDKALYREQHAQQLLNEQSSQIQEFTMKLDLYQSEESQRQKTFTEAVQNLSESRFELKQKEQIIRQLNKHLTQLELDNKELLENVRDAENALRTSAKDRDVLQLYVQNVENALEKCKRQMSTTKTLTAKDTMLAKVLLSSDLLPVEQSKAGPQVLACQNLVTAFIDTQHKIFSKFLAMEEEIEGFRKHIQSLKQELNAVCQREMDNLQVPVHEPTRDFKESTTFQPIDGTGSREHDNYQPLISKRSSLPSKFQTPSLSTKTTARSKPHEMKR